MSAGGPGKRRRAGTLSGGTRRAMVGKNLAQLQLGTRFFGRAAAARPHAHFHDGEPRRRPPGRPGRHRRGRHAVGGDRRLRAVPCCCGGEGCVVGSSPPWRLFGALVAFFAKAGRFLHLAQRRARRREFRVGVCRPTISVAYVLLLEHRVEGVARPARPSWFESRNSNTYGPNFRPLRPPAARPPRPRLLSFPSLSPLP